VVWAAVFLLIGLSGLVLLNLWRRLRLLRATTSLSVAYSLFLAVGTSQPLLDGKGSLQLPLMYLALAALQIPLMLEPFVNPWTAKREP
jgi:hypothetical protein